MAKSTCCSSNDKKKKGGGCCDAPPPKKEEVVPACETGCCDSKKKTPAAAEPARASCCKDKSDSCCAPPPTTQTPVFNAPHADDAPLCLAVIRQDGGDVVLFDAAGVPVTFHFDGGDIRNLCFNTHGVKACDDLLTPCLDEDGNHGEPEESCFCGVETPHMHAHIRDPRVCDSNGTDSNGAEKVEFLATQTLHPKDVDTTTTTTTAEMYTMNVSEQLPNECSSARMSDAGKKHNNNGGNKNGNRRMHKVQHDDHVDYLVHNAATGELHLEHACTDCGQDDIHGTFKAVAKRQLPRNGDKKSNISVQFFEVEQGPFNVLDFFNNAFQVHSGGRVAAVENILETPSKHTHNNKDLTKPEFWGIPEKEGQHAESNLKANKEVRSTLTCSRICCASEIPMITSVLEKVAGVNKIMVNVPLKQVIVDHNADTVTATELEAVLNKNHFGAAVKRDGAANAAKKVAAAAVPSKGRSHFFVAHICCASEIPAINTIVEPMRGVSSVSINVTTKTVYVDHDTGFCSAQDVADALNKEGFGAEVRLDFAKAAATTRSMFVQSTLTFEQEVDPDTAMLTIFLRSFDPSQLESFIVDVPAKTITVVHNPLGLSAQTIADQLLEPTGIRALVLSDGGANQNVWDIPTMDDSSDELSGDEPMTYPSPAVILSGVFWIVSMLSFIPGENWEYLKYVGLVSVAFGLPAIAIKAFRTLRRFQFDTNCLMFFASVGALALGEFAEAAAVVFLFALSEWLEVRATSRARSALSAIVQLRPEKANLVHPVTQELLVVPASVVPVGALVSVMTGDKIPCDGVVVEGQSTVDESSLTGEARPIRKGIGDKLSGGTVNSGMTQLMVRTTSTTENSAVSRLIRLVEEAQANRSDTEKLVDEFAKIYTPIVVVAAILMCTIPWAFGSETGKEWTNNGLILIVVACPCALIISTPVSYVAGLAATAQKGVLIKGGANLEALGLIKNICFDKTGTLTNGEFALLHMQVFGEGLSRKEVFQYLSLMEERAAHPVAQAILTGARNEGVTIPKTMKLEKHTIIAGEGVAGVINGLEVHVGNERLFDRLGLLANLTESDLKAVESWKSVGGTVGFMSIEGEGIVCSFCAADGVRPESAGVIKSLKKLGIKLTMLTGDNQEAASAVGAQVGLEADEINAKLLPSDKLEYVKSLTHEETQSALCNPCSSREYVMMCGDGVNDAPALAAADVGVAMGAGAALAMETADVTLLDSNLEKLEYSIRMGRRVIRKIKENVIFSLAVKFLVLGFALAGKASLWAAIASDVGAMILVTLNSMLLLPKRQRSHHVEALKGDVEQANKARTVIGRDSATDSDDDAGINSRAIGEVVVTASDCCASSRADRKKAQDGSKDPVGGGCCSSRDEPAPPKAESSHDHGHSHAHSEKVQDDKKNPVSGGCCSSRDEPAPPKAESSHDHGHSHAHSEKQDDTKKPVSGGCCSQEKTPSEHAHDHGHAVVTEHSHSGHEESNVHSHSAAEHDAADHSHSHEH